MLLLKIPIISMIMQSGFFAKIILVFLVFLSILSWTIIFGKKIQFSGYKRVMRKFLKKYQIAGNIKQWLKIEKNGFNGKLLYEKLVLCASGEYEKINNEIVDIKNNDKNGIFITSQFEILQSSMEQIVSKEVENMDWGLTTLAVAASVSPFIGLLGTVWGITHSFYDIGSMGSTSINIVAPGIAEALITTIFGLIVAIPCAIFYNIFSKNTRQIESQLIDFATSLVSDVKEHIIREYVVDNNKN